MIKKIIKVYEAGIGNCKTNGRQKKLIVLRELLLGKHKEPSKKKMDKEHEQMIIKHAM